MTLVQVVYTKGTQLLTFYKKSNSYRYKNNQTLMRQNKTDKTEYLKRYLFSSARYQFTRTLQPQDFDTIAIEQCFCDM